MNPAVSVLIPVYKESELLEPLLRSLLKDPYEPKEFLVTVDEPTEKTLKLIDRMKEKIRFLVHSHRVGKVNALNQAVKEAHGEILVFLDGDNKITECRESFLKDTVDEMKDVDLLDMKKKVIRDSFLSKMAHYEYLALNIVSWFFSRNVGKCLGLNGAAFAIRRMAFEKLGGFRRVPYEDLDIGTRSFIEGCKFKYGDKTEVSTKVPSPWRQWYKQRKRWGLNDALWIKEYYRELARSLMKYPKFCLPGILLIFPSLILLAINLLIPNTVHYDSPMSFMLVSVARVGIIVPSMFLTSFSMILMKNIIGSIASFGTFSTIYYFFARKLKYLFNPLEFLFFYFILSPIWLAIVILSFFEVFVKHAQIKMDWKF